MNVASDDILIAGLHCNNLSENAGFEQVARFLPYKNVQPFNFLFPDAEFGTLQKRIALIAYEAKLKTMTNNYKLVHYIFPELHLTFSQPTSNDVVSVGTIHLPVTWLDEKRTSARQSFTAKKRKEQFNRFNSIVTVTSSNIEEIKFAFPNADVKFIAHGVHDNSSNFSERKSHDRFNIITVGSNYRDLETFRSVVTRALKEQPTWHFDLVGAKAWKESLKGLSNVTVHPFLPEPQYLKLMGTSDVHLLPLTFATANNAYLEAHSCGVPTVVTDMLSTREYGLSTTTYYSTAEDLFLKLRQLNEKSIADFNLLKKRTLVESEKFNWKNIAAELTQYYSTLL